MQQIELSQEIPGIRSLFMSRPETAEQLNTLVRTLLHNPHPTLSTGERELIAAYVSRFHTCKYCCNIHGTKAQRQLGNKAEIVRQVLIDPENAPISNKMKALLKIAAKVQSDHKSITADLMEFARSEGANYIEIYDTILIADAFCMYNCYVAGLSAWQHDDVDLYDTVGEQYACEGYLTTPFEVVYLN
jgi:uncharacterized peroxidase-related enzyme